MKGVFMKAQINLTPTESKKLIAMAVASMDVVRHAADKGMLVLHPSSSTYFIAEQLTGAPPPNDAWVRGVIAPKATCILATASHRPASRRAARDVKPTPEDFPYSWLIQKQQLTTGERLGNLMEKMGPRDVYVKGANALDADNNVGILIGNPHRMGSIGYVVAARRKRGFQIVLPVGFEKLIPGTIKAAAKTATRRTYRYGMGVPCALMPISGITVTESVALETLSGARSVPIAAGGLAGGEGSIVLIVQGKDHEVEKAIACIEASKNARLPQLQVQSCDECPIKACRFPVGGKPWAMNREPTV
jgi:hypothetical protein